VAWEILLEEEVETWFLELCKSDPRTAELVSAAIDKLEHDGPMLGRPLADRVRQSRHHNMKELRPGSSSSALLGGVVVGAVAEVAGAGHGRE
jgi:hypothetical protein